MSGPGSLAPGSLYVVVFGDGYGESIVVCEPPDTWLIVDSLKWRDDGVNPALDLLAANGSAAWSGLLLTHPHTDHAVDFDRLLEHPGDGPVGCAIPPIPRHGATSSLEQRYRTTAAQSAIRAITRRWQDAPDSRWNLAETLAERQVGTLTVRPLWPGPAGVQHYDASRFNDLSTPVLIGWRSVKLLLGADLPGGRWLTLAPDPDGPLSDAQLLKAAHHGSRYDQHPHVVAGNNRHRVVAPRTTSQLPDFRDDHGIDRLQAGGEAVHTTSLPFATDDEHLTRAQGLAIQHPPDSGFGQSVRYPPRSEASDSWHVTTFTDDGGIYCHGGEAARHVEG